jgi:phosphate:Na+ symporter
MNFGAGIEWWGLAAGVGLFLFGLHLVEQALQALAGRGFKQFIRRNTSHPLRSVATGTVATAILQSSSVVGLTVLAFVGAGLVSMRNALGVIFGSNLGTTFTGWLVVIFGFKLALDEAALPLVAVGCLAMVTFRDAERTSSLGRVIAGAGFVLLGLSFMKSGAAEFADTVSLGDYPNLPLLAYLALGAGITAVVQSSSAMMMIALSALYAGLLSLEQAAAVAIGADLGTTGTVLLGAWRGTAPKKRVALAHFLFNVVTDAVAFIFLKPLLYFLVTILGIGDPLYVLVAFHSTFNAIGITIFLPALGPFSRFLQNRFRSDELEDTPRFISTVSLEVPDAATEALQREIEFLLGEAALLNRKAIGIRLELSITAHEHSFVAAHTYEQGYEFIKRSEGDILEFALELQAKNLDPELADRINHLLSAVRNGVHSTKSTKDVRHDLREFERSVNDYLAGFREWFRIELGRFYEHLDEVAGLSQPQALSESLLQLIKDNNSLHDKLHENIRRDALRHQLSDVEVSTLFNVNREVYNSNRELILALKDCRLPPPQADQFMSLPGLA